MRLRNRLTQNVINGLSPGLHCDGGGLYLQVQYPAGRSWLYRYALNGKQRWCGLGAAADIPLSQARRLRDKLAISVKGDKIDIVGERKREKAAARPPVTFKQAAAAFLAGQTHWKDARQAQQWAGSLRDYVLPVLGDMNVNEIERRDVIRCLEPHWLKVPETMRRVRGRVEAVLDYSIARGDRTEENPAIAGPILKGLPRQPKKNGDQHYGSMPYAKVPALVGRLREANTGAGLALEFLILTAARANEVCGARWDEINRAENVWTIAAARMKSGRPHRVPLSDQAMQVLERAANQSEYMFPGQSGEGLSTRALLKALPRAGGTGTVHGLRSTFRTWVQEATEFDGNIAEAALAHKVGDSTERAYARSDLFAKRRRLMQAWADYCGA